MEGLGADRVIDYRVEDFTKDQQRYDVVLDAVGKSSFGRCKRVLRPRGVAVLSFPRQQSPALLWRSRLLYPAVRTAKRVVPAGRPAPLELPLRSEQEFLAAVDEAGLSVEETRRIGRFSSHLVLRAGKR